MKNKKILFTEKTPPKSKQYFIDYLKEKKIRYKSIKGDGVILLLEKTSRLDKNIYSRIKDFMHYCSMNEVK